MPRKGGQPVPIKAEVYSVLTIGVPAGAAGAKATEQAVEQLRRKGYGAGVLAGPIGPEATVAIRDVINSTAAAVKAEHALGSGAAPAPPSSSRPKGRGVRPDSETTNATEGAEKSGS